MLIGSGFGAIKIHVHVPDETVTCSFWIWERLYESVQILGPFSSPCFKELVQMLRNSIARRPIHTSLKKEPGSQPPRLPPSSDMLQGIFVC